MITSLRAKRSNLTEKLLMVMTFSFLLSLNLFSQKDTLKNELNDIYYPKNKIKIDTFQCKNNAVHATLGGNTGIYSFDYERKIAADRNGFATIRIGLVIGPIEIVYPATLLNFIFFNGKHHLEIGGGARFPAAIGINRITNKFEYSWDNYDFVGTGSLMYRYQKQKFIFRIGWTPLFYPLNKNSGPVEGFYRIFCGVSAGYAF